MEGGGAPLKLRRNSHGNFLLFGIPGMSCRNSCHHNYSFSSSPDIRESRISLRFSQTPSCFPVAAAKSNYLKENFLLFHFKQTSYFFNFKSCYRFQFNFDLRDLINNFDLIILDDQQTTVYLVQKGLICPPVNFHGDFQQSFSSQLNLNVYKTESRGVLTPKGIPNYLKLIRQLLPRFWNF